MCNTTASAESASQRGALIVLEGLDRSGKSTQAAKLQTYLQSQGKSCRIQRFPDRQEPLTGEVIDNFLRNAKDVKDSAEVMHLLFSANRWAVAPRIREEIEQGTTLILDRYSYSGVTYSLAKGLDSRWTAQPEVGLPRPDLVLFFDVSPDKTAERSGFGDEVLERSDFQCLVYANMKNIFNENYWKRINADGTVDEVHANVTREVDQVLQNIQTPVQSLSLSDFGL